MLRSIIPPRTMSDVSREQRAKTKKLEARVGFGARSLGNKLVSGGSSWDGTVLKYKKPKQNPLNYISDIVEDYNGHGDLGVTIQFRGFSFLEVAFTKSSNDYGRNTCVYYTSVMYRDKRAVLVLSTMGDILEFEVVHQKKRLDQLFNGEISIQELTKVYDPSSMEVVQRNGIVVVSYKKRNNKHS